MILLDDAACSAIYGSISGATHGNSQGGWTLPSNATDLPSTISFAVGNYMYSIPGIDLLFADAGDGRAYGSIQSRGQNSQDILGDVSIFFAQFRTSVLIKRSGLLEARVCNLRSNSWCAQDWIRPAHQVRWSVLGSSCPRLSLTNDKFS